MAHRPEHREIDKDELQEECGVLGVIEPDSQIINPLSLYLAHKMLQSRGQDMAGISLSGGKLGNKFETQIVPGKIGELYKDSVLQEMFQRGVPTIAIAHNRYATKGKADKQSTFNGQPFVTEQIGGAHNGNDESFVKIKEKTQLKVAGDSDSAWMISYMDQELAKYGSMEEMLIHVLSELSSSYSLVLNAGNRIIAARDPWGNRPLCYGRTAQGGWIVASESVSITASGGTYIREVLPGEIITFFGDGTCKSIIFAKHPHGEQKCSLESHYFSNANSYDGEKFNYEYRQAMGAGAAMRFAQKNIQVDCGIPILASGEYAGLGAIARLHLAKCDAIQLNDTIEYMRSFIENNDAARDQTVNEKLVIFPEMIDGKSVLLIDDSIVRGTSLRRLIKNIKALKEKGKGPREIHILISSPPVVDTCDLGVNISEVGELLAGQWRDLPLDEIEVKVAEFLGVNSVTFSTPQIVQTALGKKEHQMCDHCFGGKHPVKEGPPPVYLADHQAEIQAQPTVLYISAKEFQPLKPTQPAQAPSVNMHEMSVSEVRKRGMDLQDGQLIEEEKAVLGGIIDLICNGKELPPVVVLAGWRAFLSPTSVKHLLKEIPKEVELVLVEHALIEPAGGTEVQTSMGMIPQFREPDQIAEAYVRSGSENIFATGVTAMRVKLNVKDKVVSHKLLKQEIGMRPQENIQQLRERVYRSEEQAVSVVVQRALLERVTRQEAKLPAA
jgi:amidophosphoribosyltransferase